MNLLTSLLKALCFILFTTLFCQNSYAHNGKTAYAYPIGKITVDGDFSDWPKQITKYNIGTILTDAKTQNSSDFSGFFQVGYRTDNHSLYLAFTITDDYFTEDTTENARFDSQDGLELCLDARHLPFIIKGILLTTFQKF